MVYLCYSFRQLVCMFSTNMSLLLMLAGGHLTGKNVLLAFRLCFVKI